MRPGSEIGGRAAWILSRLLELVFLLVGVILLIALPLPFSLVAFGFALLPVVVLYPIACLNVDDEGITFRRWFKKYRVPWKLVREVEYSFFGLQLRIHLKKWVGGSRAVYIPIVTSLNPSLQAAWKLARMEVIPEEVLWLKSKVGSNTRRNWSSPEYEKSNLKSLRAGRNEKIP
jgi:hypothetical protein